MSSDFLSENNLAGQAILRLVSRGHSIIAELFQLSENIPPVFLMTERDKPKYGNIVFDFKYLGMQDLCEKRIDDSPELTELDEDFRETHIDLLGRFYMLFEGIYKYARDFDKYLNDLEDGVYIQLTVESVLLTFEGKQLLSEALYLYGVMLLLLDTYLEGPVRERLMISYYRYKGQQGIDNIDAVCNLLRGTGYSPANPYKRPTDNYPEDYFARYPFNKDLLNMILGRLRSDDIYNQIKAYPNPDHRSTALASQASMLYVILYFFPNILNKEQAIMREIVDKHFADNWVVSYYLGSYVDLSMIWEPYKAARAALSNTMSLTNVKETLQRHTTRMEKTAKDLTHFLTEGVLTEEYILDSINKVLICMREANVTIRWLMLHYKTDNKKAKEIIATGPEKGRILQLLLNAAQFEFILKNVFRKLLEGKNDRWEGSRKQAFDRMVELGEYFSGEKPLTRVEKDEQLQKWFFSLSEQIKNLEYKDSTLAGRTIQQLVQALEEVEQFHQIESSLQIKQFLHDTRQCLFVMLRTINIKEEVMIIMSIVADFSFAWKVINDYVPLMQGIIKMDPSSTIKLRSTFLKLASLLETPCLRIQQCKSPDLVSVSSYYSGRLLEWVRNVLEIVPISAFEILKEIIDLLTYKIQELPTRLEKDRIRDFAQLDQRYALARATHQVSVYADGILAMDKTLVGVIEVDPRKLLEDGLRKQLVLRIATSLDKMLIFKTGKLPDFEKRLVDLAAMLDGYKRSFEYISDYVNIYGLKVWQEEFCRIIDFNVEQECNSYLKKKVYDWQSQFQNVAIPIPVFPPSDDDSMNFVGRLAREFLLQIDARKATYVDIMNAWISPSGSEVVGIRTFSLLRRTIGVFGLNGFNRLLSFMMVRIMRMLIKTTQTEILSVFGKAISEAVAIFEPVSTIPPSAQKVYGSVASNLKKFVPRFQEYIMNVGQRQLLRRMIGKELNFSCKLDSNVLACSLKDLNSAVLKDIERHYLYPSEQPYPKTENHLLEELTKYLDAGGFDSPFAKLYVTSDPIEHYPFVIFLMVISILPKLNFEPRLGTLVCQDKKENLDGIPFVVGIITLMKHSHSTNTQKFLAYMGQYVRSLVNTVGQKNENDISSETINGLLFLEDFCRLSNTSRRVVEAYVPAYLFDCFRH